MEKLFRLIPFNEFCNASLSNLPEDICSKELCQNADRTDRANGEFWGIPFDVPSKDKDVMVVADGDGGSCWFEQCVYGDYLVFMHTADVIRPGYGDGFQYPFHGMDRLDDFLRDEVYLPYRGVPKLSSDICEYVVFYEDGDIIGIPITMRRNIGEWGNPMHQCFECVPHIKATSFDTASDELSLFGSTKREYGFSLFRADAAGAGHTPIFWLYAWKNPKPEKGIVKIEIRKTKRTILLAGITSCKLDSNPLRWETRKRLCLDFNGEIEGIREDDRIRICEAGLVLNKNIGITMGQVISVQPALQYPDKDWEKTRLNCEPVVLKNRYMVEYTAHSEADILLGDSRISLKKLKSLPGVSIESEEVEIKLRILDGETMELTPARIHIHGENGEYLCPHNRTRLPNPHWFQDYSTEYILGKHFTTYVDGDVELSVPRGRIYIEVAKGFEYIPFKKVINIDRNGQELTVVMKHAANWRAKGWVSADTHVHFLSTMTARLEGRAEGVNVINLLTTQWGEFFTNLGDFDGETTLGEGETGEECLVRVGSENRQKMLGHISLIGYAGKMITPLTTGIPDEGALGTALEQMPAGLALQVKKQGGLAVYPHYTCPQADAAAIVLGRIDGIELVSWEDPYAGINPYALSDWYRYLNCGFQLTVVGGTDKMNAETAIGTSRTYSYVKKGRFTYEDWKDSIRAGNTFATYGPLIEGKVDGHPIGDVMNVSQGQVLSVEWNLSSIILPVTQVELIVNGRIGDLVRLDRFQGETEGRFFYKVNGPCWIALRVRGSYADKPEMIAAHTSTVMCKVNGKKHIDPEAVATVSELLEAQREYLKTLAPRASEERRREMFATIEEAKEVLRTLERYVLI